MRHPRFGMALACLAALMLSFLAPVSAMADFIRAGATGQTESVPDVSDAVPVPAPAPDPLGAEGAGRVGFTLAPEEFIGGVIMLTIFVGGTIYLGILAGRNEI